MKAMILAAGEGTRLRPYTLTMPKPMLSVAGKPTLEWILLWLRHFGIRDVVINLHHQPDPVRNYFGDGAALGVNLTFSVEERILGTAGGIKRVAHLFREPMVVVYGDVLTDLDLHDLIKFHQTRGTEPHATLTLCRAAKPWECGVVALDGNGRVTRFVEKPKRDEIFSDLTNAGILILDPPVIDLIPTTVPCDLSGDVLPKLLALNVPVYAQLLDDSTYLIDMGTLEKYERVQKEWPTAKAAKYLEANCNG